MCCAKNCFINIILSYNIIFGVSISVCNWVMSEKFVWECVWNINKLRDIYLLRPWWVFSKPYELNLNESKPEHH